MIRKLLLAIALVVTSVSTLTASSAISMTRLNNRNGKTSVTLSIDLDKVNFRTINGATITVKGSSYDSKEIIDIDKMSTIDGKPFVTTLRFKKLTEFDTKNDRITLHTDKGDIQLPLFND